MLSDAEECCVELLALLACKEDVLLL